MSAPSGSHVSSPAIAEPGLLSRTGGWFRTLLPVADVAVDDAGRPAWQVSLLGFGLVAYALLVMAALLLVFPPSLPSRDVVAALKARADVLAKDAQLRDSAALAARRTGDTANLPILVARATTAQRLADVARLRADSVEQAALDPSLVPAPVRIGKLTLAENLQPDWRFLILAMLAGALGAFLHVAQSFATFVGNRTFSWSWTWWYLLRPFIGAGLALVVYVVFRSALVPGTSGNATNAYGVVALAALSGMFSKQAIDKLNEVFTVAFRAAPGHGDAQRADKPEGESDTSAILGIDPPRPVAQAGTLSFVVRGSGFGSAAVIYLDDTAIPTKQLDATRLSASIAVKDLPGSGPFKLTVRTPPKPGAAPTDAGTTVGPISLPITI